MPIKLISTRVRIAALRTLTAIEQMGKAMFNSVSTLFKVNKKLDKAPSDHEIKLATARLMLEVIKADGYVGKIELVTMSEVLRREFNLKQTELNELFAEISGPRPDEGGLQKITRTICETWGNAKRMKLLENLWIIALADQHIDQDETTLVRMLANQLCLNEMQIFRSQENAKLKMGIEDF